MGASPITYFLAAAANALIGYTMFTATSSPIQLSLSYRATYIVSALDILGFLGCAIAVWDVIVQARAGDNTMLFRHCF